MKQRFEFIVEGEQGDDDPPVIVSVRRWLKEGKRRFGLTCTEGRQLQDLANHPQAGDSTAPDQQRSETGEKESSRHLGAVSQSAVVK